MANSVSINFFFREFTSHSLSLPRIHFEFTIFFANLLSIYYLFRGFTSISLFLSRILFEFPIFPNSIRIHSIFCEFTLDSLSVSRNHCQSTIFVANSLSFLRIHYLFRESTFHLLSLRRIHFEITIYFANSLRQRFS